MGIAAYNRGSRLIRDSLSADTPRDARSLPGSVTHPAPDREPIEVERRFAVGDVVYCHVLGYKWRYWPHKVKQVRAKAGASDYSIKTDYGGGWAPARNFRRDPPA